MTTTAIAIPKLDDIYLPDWVDYPGASLLDWANGVADFPFRYACAYGGRGGTKSNAFAILVNIYAMAHPGETIAIVREFRQAIQDGAVALIYAWAQILGLPAHKPAHSSRILYGNNAKVIPLGAERNRNNLRGLETASVGWFEEAEPISQDAFDIADPSLRRPGAKVLISFNPEKEDSFIYQTFVANDTPNSFVVKVNYDAYHKTFGTPELDAARRRTLDTDPASYAYIWGGELRTAKGAVFQPYKIEEREPMEDPDRVVRGWDLAASQDTGDYTVGVKLAMKKMGDHTAFQLQDVIRGQWDTLGVRRRVTQAAVADGDNVHVVIEMAGGEGGKQSQRMWRDNLIGARLRFVNPTGSKVDRAVPLAGAMNEGFISRVPGKWWLAMSSELAAFSEDTTEMKGVHDDQVDAFAHAYNYLAGRRHTPQFTARG